MLPRKLLSALVLTSVLSTAPFLSSAMEFGQELGDSSARGTATLAAGGTTSSSTQLLVDMPDDVLSPILAPPRTCISEGTRAEQEERVMVWNGQAPDFLASYRASLACRDFRDLFLDTLRSTANERREVQFSGPTATLKDMLIAQHFAKKAGIKVGVSYERAHYKDIENIIRWLGVPIDGLYITECNIEIGQCKASISQLLENSPQLERFSLENLSQFHDPYMWIKASEILKIFQTSNKNLRDLYLRNNNLSMFSMADILSIFENNNNLITVDLSGNNQLCNFDGRSDSEIFYYTMEGTMRKILSPSRTLRILNMRNCGLRTRTVQAIAGSLANSNLRYLDLRDNPCIDKEGKQAIEKAVQARARAGNPINVLL